MACRFLISIHSTPQCLDARIKKHPSHISETLLIFIRDSVNHSSRFSGNPEANAFMVFLLPHTLFVRHY